jgi:MFS family permease
VDRRATLVFLAKAVRTFCYGFLGILFPVHLSRLGLGAEGIGAAVTLTLIGSAAMTVAVRRPAERLGGRAVLVALAGLVTLAGVLFATTRHPGLAVLAAVVGNLAVSVGETGPFLSIEQVLLARTGSGTRLTMTMSLYNLVGYGAAALGSLTVALLGRVVGGEEPYAPLFWVFAASGVVQALVYARLRPGPTPGPPAAARPGLPSRGLIYRLTALFALDALAGGFVVQSLIAYWFVVHFGLGLAELGGVFSGTQVLTAISFLVAARSATRFGLVNTMVVSHLVSNALLIAMAFAPTARVAIALLLARHLLSQMDVPTRQAYLVSVVEDHEREAAVTLTNAARTVAQSITPAFTGYVMQAVGLSAPFVLGGSLKIVYDVLLYAMARGHRSRVERA